MNTTDEITRDVLKVLHCAGHVAWRQGVAHVRGRRVPKDSQGIGDIVGVLRPDGKHVEVEVKQRPDRLSDAQVKHSHAIAGAGGVHLTVYSLKEFLSWWTEYSSGD